MNAIKSILHRLFNFVAGLAVKISSHAVDMVTPVFSWCFSGDQEVPSFLDFINFLFGITIMAVGIVIFSTSCTLVVYCLTVVLALIFPADIASLLASLIFFIGIRFAIYGYYVNTTRRTVVRAAAR